MMTPGRTRGINGRQSTITEAVRDEWVLGDLHLGG